MEGLAAHPNRILIGANTQDLGKLTRFVNRYISPDIRDPAAALDALSAYIQSHNEALTRELPVKQLEATLLGHLQANFQDRALFLSLQRALGAVRSLEVMRKQEGQSEVQAVQAQMEGAKSFGAKFRLWKRVNAEGLPEGAFDVACEETNRAMLSQATKMAGGFYTLCEQMGWCLGNQLLDRLGGRELSIPELGALHKFARGEQQDEYLNLSPEQFFLRLVTEVLAKRFNFDAEEVYPILDSLDEAADSMVTEFDKFAANLQQSGSDAKIDGTRLWEKYLNTLVSVDAGELTIGHLALLEEGWRGAATEIMTSLGDQHVAHYRGLQQSWDRANRLYATFPALPGARRQMQREAARYRFFELADRVDAPSREHRSAAMKELRSTYRYWGKSAKLSWGKRILQFEVLEGRHHWLEISDHANGRRFYIRDSRGGTLQYPDARKRNLAVESYIKVYYPEARNFQLNQVK